MPIVNRAGRSERLEEVLVHLPFLEALLEELLPRKFWEIPTMLALHDAFSQHVQSVFFVFAPDLA